MALIGTKCVLCLNEWMNYLKHSFTTLHKPQLSRVVFVADSPRQLYTAPGVEKQFHSEMNNLSTGALCGEAWRGAE